MTNQEKMCKLSPEDFYEKLYWLFTTYGETFTNSRTAIIDWLKLNDNVHNEKGTCQTCRYCHILWKDGNAKSLCCDYWEDTYEVNKRNFCDYFKIKDD